MSARRWGRCGLLLGLLASCAAQVAHALTLGSKAGPLVGAAFWPVALLISSELVFRARATHWGDRVALLAVACVGLGAGWISFAHTRALLISWSESHTGATLGALAMDGLLVASGLTIYRESAYPSALAQVHSDALADAPSALAQVHPDALADAHPDAPSALADAHSRVHPDAGALVHPSAPALVAALADAHPRVRTRVHSPVADALGDDVLVERMRVLSGERGTLSLRTIQRECGIGQERAKRIRDALA